MEFKSIATPRPWEGVSIVGKKIVVPDMSLTLTEILDRFTRGEPLEIGQDASYHESEDDLEKIAHWDLVDRQEYIDKMKGVQARYEREEKARQEKALQDYLAKKAEEAAKLADSQKAK